MSAEKFASPDVSGYENKLLRTEGNYGFRNTDIYWKNA